MRWLVDIQAEDRVISYLNTRGACSIVSQQSIAGDRRQSRAWATRESEENRREEKVKKSEKAQGRNVSASRNTAAGATVLTHIEFMHA